MSFRFLAIFLRAGIESGSDSGAKRTVYCSATYYLAIYKIRDINGCVKKCLMSPLDFSGWELHEALNRVEDLGLIRG